MVVLVSVPRQKYRRIRAHLFKGHKEQGCFLFTHINFNHTIINLCVKEVRLIEADKWDKQTDFHLELKDKEKVKVMLKARKNNYDLLECHSHRSLGVAKFSPSDRFGLNEFVRYVWWKLPGRIYGAVVWTENDVTGQVWLPKKNIPLPIREIRITD
ncbi:MAG: hypothetical protein ABIA97_05830 [Candidatus Omnitrophota bacterium]